MPVIALVGNKGGAGKTTLCINLADRLSHSHDVLILDADPQQSSWQWREIAEGNTSLNVIPAMEDVEAAYKQLEQKPAYCLIDCPPSVHSRQMQQALRLSDLAVVPVQPSPLDIWATVHIEAEVEQARKDNARLQALLVINQMEPRTRLSQIMNRALAELSMPAAQASIRRRAAYRNSFLEGKTVHQLGARGRDAMTEIDDLIREMEKYL